MWCRFDGNEWLCNIRCVMLNYYGLGLLQVSLKSFMISVDYRDYMGSSLETWLLVDRFSTWTLIIWSVLWHISSMEAIVVPYKHQIHLIFMNDPKTCKEWLDALNKSLVKMDDMSNNFTLLWSKERHVIKWGFINTYLRSQVCSIHSLACKTSSHQVAWWIYR